MKFRTKLWRRSGQSFAATIPQVVTSFLDLSKKYDLEWLYDPKPQQWLLGFVEQGKKAKEGVKIYTKLWKRSQNSYATTMPLAVLLHIDEKKAYDIEWEFDKKTQKWLVRAVEALK